MNNIIFNDNCPLCGEDAEHEIQYDPESSGGFYTVVCYCCGFNKYWFSEDEYDRWLEKHQSQINKKKKKTVIENLEEN
jgi:hypothetical protein